MCWLNDWLRPGISSSNLPPLETSHSPHPARAPPPPSVNGTPTALPRPSSSNKTRPLSSLPLVLILSPWLPTLALRLLPLPNPPPERAQDNTLARDVYRSLRNRGKLRRPGLALLDQPFNPSHRRTFIISIRHRHSNRLSPRHLARRRDFRMRRYRCTVMSYGGYLRA